MNWNEFYIINTEERVLDLINSEKNYYRNFYDLFSGKKDKQEYIFDLKNNMKSLSDIERNNIVLKIIKNTFVFYFDSFKFRIEELSSVDSDIIHLSKKSFSMICNKDLIILFSILKEDLDKFCEYYYLYLIDTFRDFDIDSNRIDIVLERNGFYRIWEGVHRFIICYIRDIKPKFHIKKSNWKAYDDILRIVKADHESMYKKMSSDIILYNRIPSFLFDEYKIIRDDRSIDVIGYLSNHACKNGLEIGPQNGLMTIELANRGYSMKCVEHDSKYYELTKSVAELCGVEKKVEVILNDIHNYYADIHDGEFDFIVSLSVFYHLRRNDSESFEKLLYSLIEKTKILIFDDEPNTQIFTKADIDRYVDRLEVDVEVISSGSDNRTIYAIVRR